LHIVYVRRKRPRLIARQRLYRLLHVLAVAAVFLDVPEPPSVFLRRSGIPSRQRFTDAGIRAAASAFVVAQSIDVCCASKIRGFQDIDHYDLSHFKLPPLTSPSRHLSIVHWPVVESWRWIFHYSGMLIRMNK
jgi:hypothetical protein